MVKFHEDEFILIRTRDGAKIIERLFLTEEGFGQTPHDSERENKQLAQAILGWLESEKTGRVSFGKI